MATRLVTTLNPLRVLGFTALVMIGIGCAAGVPSASPTTAPPFTPVGTQTMTVQLPSGTATVDVFCCDTGQLRPLVVVAHGFARSRANMVGWGRALAEAGYIAAVPDLPAWSDHARNARFINELVEHLAGSPLAGLKVDRQRIGLMGFSAGGLATILAAADNPGVRIWVGLDPVDRDGLGAAAAAKLRCHVVVLRAQPSSCNADGNAVGIERVVTGSCFKLLVPLATHSDPEWPTDWKAELMCGKSSEERRAVFVKHALQELQVAFAAKSRR